MRSLRFIAIAVLAAALPCIALAQSSSSAQGSSLVSEITQLEQQIASLTGGSENASAQSSVPANTSVQPASGTGYSGVCPDLSENLALGSSGSDVANLQAFLAGQGLFSAGITAYFGTITKTAVEEWQESHGVVAGGSAATTGFGVVGPKTRAAISQMCSASSAPVSCISTQPPATDCPTAWQPVLDQNGCTMYYQCAVTLPTGAAQASSTGSLPSSSACPVVQQPTCGGEIVPFQSDSNGCVTSYECVL